MLPPITLSSRAALLAVDAQSQTIDQLNATLGAIPPCASTCLSDLGLSNRVTADNAVAWCGTILSNLGFGRSCLNNCPGFPTEQAINAPSPAPSPPAPSPPAPSPPAPSPPAPSPIPPPLESPSPIPPPVPSPTSTTAEVTVDPVSSTTTAAIATLPTTTTGATLTTTTARTATSGTPVTGSIATNSVSRVGGKTVIENSIWGAVSVAIAMCFL
ncbi:hypothetical protein BC829DRAFT_403368 [Chytridium lagenaria]|nr:hypothetical protein BC829DRAFT_403368 [Chytridium lagenaria]